MTESPLPPLTPDLYGEGPAREADITVVERWAQCANLPDDHPEQELEFFHRQLNEEANVLENAASSLVEFPDADWPIRLWLARQCADEARHVLVYKRLLESRGGRVGQYPVMNFQYRILRKVDTLIGRLAVQNRTVEADGLDAVTHAVAQAEAAGDMSALAVYDAQQADEIVHVGFANEWIRRQIKQDPLNVLRMSAALTQGARAFQEVFAGGGTAVSAYGVAREERLKAGFESGEIEVAHEMAEQRREEARLQHQRATPRTG